MQIDKLSGRDLTSGSLHRNIWYLAVPMTLEFGVISISQLMDIYWIGKLGSAALAAVTISTSIRWVINSMSNGLGNGGMAVVSRRIGERDQEAASHALWQTILLGITVSLILAIPGILLARPLLALLGADSEVLPLGLSYLYVTMGGLFTIVLVFITNSMLRGAGEARLAMMVLFLSAAVTVLLQPVLIFGWGPLPTLGVAGSAWATVLGYGTGVILQMVILLRGHARIRINLHNLKPDLPLIGRIIRIALPSTIQMLIRSTSRLIIVGLVGVYGTFAIAAYGVANRILMIIIIPAFGLGNAASTLVGQNLGALKPKRAEQNVWWVSAYTSIYMVISVVLVFVYARPLIGFFDPTPQVVAMGVECLKIVAPTLVISAIGIVLGRGFVGAGDTVPPMTVNLFTLWGMELPFAYGLSNWLGLDITGIWWGRAIANIANGLLFVFWFRLGNWKQRKV